MVLLDQCAGEPGFLWEQPGGAERCGLHGGRPLLNRQEAPLVRTVPGSPLATRYKLLSCSQETSVLALFNL